MNYNEFIEKMSFYKKNRDFVSIEETYETIREMIEVRGDRMAKTIAVEELSELIQRVCKDLREDTSNTTEKKVINRNCIIEEIVDSLNFIKALMIIYNITDSEYNAARTTKIKRMQERINELRNNK